MWGADKMVTEDNKTLCRLRYFFHHHQRLNVVQSVAETKPAILHSLEPVVKRFIDEKKDVLYILVDGHGNFARESHKDFPGQAYVCCQPVKRSDKDSDHLHLPEILNVLLSKYKVIIWDVTFIMLLIYSLFFKGHGKVVVLWDVCTKYGNHGYTATFTAPYRGLRSSSIPSGCMLTKSLIGVPDILLKVYFVIGFNYASPTSWWYMLFSPAPVPTSPRRNGTISGTSPRGSGESSWGHLCVGDHLDFTMYYSRMQSLLDGHEDHPRMEGASVPTFGLLKWKKMPKQAKLAFISRHWFEFLFHRGLHSVEHLHNIMKRTEFTRSRDK